MRCNYEHWCFQCGRTHQECTKGLEKSTDRYCLPVNQLCEKCQLERNRQYEVLPFVVPVDPIIKFSTWGDNDGSTVHKKVS
jgi:hypothetical protein